MIICLFVESDDENVGWCINAGGVPGGYKLGGDIVGGGVGGFSSTIIREKTKFFPPPFNEAPFITSNVVHSNNKFVISVLNKVLSLLPQSKVQASDIRQQAARNYMWKMAGDKVKTQDAQKIFKQMKLALDNLDK